MKLKRRMLVLVGVYVVLAVVLCGILMFWIQLETNRSREEKGQASEGETVLTFESYTELESFQDIPAMVVDGAYVMEADHVGSDEVLTINGTTLADYGEYLALLEDQGYVKYADNGEAGLDESVYCAKYTKDDMVLTVTQMAKSDITYLSAEKNASLSQYLVYSDGYADEMIEGADTTLAMLELYDRGNSFVFQLKNGHFIVNDGGHASDLERLLTYMEERVPEGDIPVVEAWFCSHFHDDHIALFATFAESPAHADRVRVNGIYAELMEDGYAETYGVKGHMNNVVMATMNLKTADGNRTPIYRPHAGERYYFSDITVDVMLTCTQVPIDNWSMYESNYNEASFWLMYTVEGQKFMIGGDGDWASMQVVMRNYDSEYLTMDIMAVQHHGINVYNVLSDYVTVNTLLYPHYGTRGVFVEGTTWQAKETATAYLNTLVDEYLSYGDGGKVLTFPYEVGTAQSLPLIGERAELIYTGTGTDEFIQY